MNHKISERVIVGLVLLLLAGSASYGEILHGFFGSGFIQNDSNINPDPEFIEFSSKKSDMMLGLDVEYDLLFKGSGQSGGFRIGLLNEMYFEENDFNNGTTNLSAFYHWNELGRVSFYVNYTYSHFTVDQDAVAHFHTINPAFFIKQDDKRTWLIKMRIKNFSYYDEFVNYNYDGNDVGVGVQWIWEAHPQHTLSFGGFINQALLDSEEVSYLGIKINVEWTWDISPEVNVYGVFSPGTKNFDEDYLLENEPRKETYIYLTGGFDYNIRAGKFGRLFGGFVIYNNMSNVEDLDTNRFQISVGYAFDKKF